MLDLEVGQVVTLELLSGIIDSSSLHETCWNGFLYDPDSPDETNPMSAQAWSVHKTVSETAEDFFDRVNYFLNAL